MMTHPADTAPQNHLFDAAADALDRGDEQAAMALLRQVVTLDPSDDEALVMLARLTRDAGDTAAAEAMLATALDANSEASVELMLELADTRLALGDPHGASGPIKRALALQPNHAETLYLLGNAFMDAGHQIEAQRAFRASLDSDPFSAATWYNLALVCHALGDVDGEREALAAYLRTSPEADDRGHVEALLAKLA